MAKKEKDNPRSRIRSSLKNLDTDVDTRAKKFEEEPNRYDKILKQKEAEKREKREKKAKIDKIRKKEKRLKDAQNE